MNVAGQTRFLDVDGNGFFTLKDERHVINQLNRVTRTVGEQLAEGKSPGAGQSQGAGQSPDVGQSPGGGTGNVVLQPWWYRPVVQTPSHPRWANERELSHGAAARHDPFGPRPVDTFFAGYDELALAAARRNFRRAEPQEAVASIADLESVTDDAFLDRASIARSTGETRSEVDRSN